MTNEIRKYTEIRVVGPISVSSSGGYYANLRYRCNGKYKLINIHLNSGAMFRVFTVDLKFPLYFQVAVRQSVYELLGNPKTRFYETDRYGNERYDDLRYYDAEYVKSLMLNVWG